MTWSPLPASSAPYVYMYMYVRDLTPLSIIYQEPQSNLSCTICNWYQQHTLYVYTCAPRPRLLCTQAVRVIVLCCSLFLGRLLILYDEWPHVVPGLLIVRFVGAVTVGKLQGETTGEGKGKVGRWRFAGDGGRVSQHRVQLISQQYMYTL